MRVKALKSFVGKVSMTVGEIREIMDEKLANDLLKAGHVVEVKAEKAVAKKADQPQVVQIKKTK